MKHAILAAACLVLAASLSSPAPAQPKAEPDPSANSPAASSFVADICRTLAQAAADNDLPEEFFTRLIWQESRFNPDAVSPKGAVGIAQIMPDTARDPGYGVTPIEDRTDPEESLRFSAEFMRALLDEYNGDYGLALAAYNAGPRRVNEAGGIPNIPETQNYVSSILGSGGIPSDGGLSMGYPESSLPSDSLSMGVPFDQGLQDLTAMIPDAIRSAPTDEQYQSLMQQIQRDQEALNQGTRSEAPSEGIFSLLKARSTPTVVERMGLLQ